MTRPPKYIAADPFEALVESSIVRAEDLYNLDGEMLLRARDGRIETCDAELLAPDF